ncbi:integrase catalytic domain-containing protein [Trichonephila clavipes]|nr:integrase catalytic domain-containing protein [Trichonephila clavipes]
MIIEVRGSKIQVLRVVDKHIDERLEVKHAVEEIYFCKRLKYRQAVLKDLRKRFRSEYLGVLIQRINKKSRNVMVSVGEIIMVRADNKKEIIWPLGHITEIIPGKDGQIRLVRVQTSQQEFLHPIQRIYPLEITSSDNFSTPMIPAGCGSPVVQVSNHGRHVMSSIPVPLKTRRVGQRCTLNLSRAETSSVGVVW